VTCLKGVMMAPEPLQNLEPNMPSTNSDVLRIADAEVDVADIETLNVQNPKVIVRHKARRWLARHDSDKSKPHGAK
jgi:hypothetical protein